MDPWPTISEIAARQYGRISALQARTAGLDPGSLSRLAARHHWDRPLRGVYAPTGAIHLPEGKLIEALLTVGPPVLVCGWSAAWLWGLVRTLPTRPEIVMPHERKAGRSQPAIVVRRSRTLRRDDGVVHRGLPVTTVARTLCDLAAVTDQDALRGLLIDARQRRLVDLAAVAERSASMGTAPGLRLLRGLLRELDEVHCDSVLEHHIRARFAEVPGLPPPAPAPVPVPVRGRVLHVDIGWPDFRVGVEVDGFGGHSQRTSLETDARRHNALQLADWRILRATWAHAGADFPDLLASLRRLVV